MTTMLGTGPISTAKPAIIEKAPLRFVITDSPSNVNIESHVKDLLKFNVRHVCRASEPGYDTAPLTQAGIQVHELAFPDGDPPPEHVLAKFLQLVQQCFAPNLNSKIKSKGKGAASVPVETVKPLQPGERMSVHCVAGLGRAPVLVAVALVEFCNLEPLEAVQFIRQQRRGAINKKQLKWLEQYQPRMRATGCGAGCSIQ